MYHPSDPRAAAPVATTTLGLRGCTCAPKEVVNWFTSEQFAVGLSVYRHVMWNDVISRKKKKWAWSITRPRVLCQPPHDSFLIIPPFPGRSPPASLLSRLRVQYLTYIRILSFLCVTHSSRTRSCRRRRRRTLQAFFSSTFLPPYPRIGVLRYRGTSGHAGLVFMGSVS